MTGKKKLDLSKFNLFSKFGSILNRLPPEQAFEIQRRLVQVVGESPEMKDVLAGRGVTTSQFIGAMTKGSQSLAQVRKRQGHPETVGQAVGINLIEEPLRGFQDVFATFGAGEPEASPAGAARLPDWIPLFGDQSVGRTIGAVGLNLLGFSKLVGGTSALMSRILPAAPKAASTLAFGSAGTSMEAASQLGRKVAKGEDIDLSRIATEGIIAAAAGIPANRALAALASGGTAAGVMAAGGDVDPDRLMAEVGFALALGNPRIADARLKPREADFIRPDDPVKAAEIKNPLAPEPVDINLELPPQLRVLLEAKNASAKVSPEAAEYMAARARQTARATQFSTELLQKIANDPVARPVGQVAADAIAVKTGQTRPPDAPGQLPLPPKDVQSAYYDPLANHYIRKEVPKARAEGNLELEQRLIQEIFERQIASAEQNLSHKQAAPNRQVAASAADESFGNNKPIDNAGYELTEDFRRASQDLDAQIMREVNRNAGADTIKPLVEARTTLQEMFYRSLQGVTPQSSGEALHFAEVMLRGGDTKADVHKIFGEIEKAWPEYAGDIAGLADKRVKQLLRVPERRAINSQLQQANDRLRQYGVEIKGEWDEAASAVASVIESSGIAKGQLRKVGGVRAVIDHLSDAVPSKSLRTFLSDLAPRKRKEFITAVNKLLFRPSPEKMNPSQLRTEAFRHGVRLEGLKTRTNAYFGGQKKTFKSARALGKWLQLVSDGTAGDPMGLQIAAAKRGMTAKHIGDGEYLIHDHINQVRDTASSIAEAHSKISERPDLSADAPELVPGAPATTPGMIRRAGINGEDLRLDGLDPGTLGAQHKGSLTGEPGALPTAFIPLQFRNLATLAQDLEGHYPKIPIYNEYVKPLLDAESKRRRSLRLPLQELSRLKSQVRPGRQQGWLEAFISPHSRRAVAATHDLNSREVKALNQAEKWVKDNFDLDPLQLIRQMQNFRRAAGDPSRAMPHSMLPPQLEFARNDIMEGKIRLDNDNPWAVFHDLAMSKGNHQHLNPIMPRAMEVRNAFKKEMIGGGGEAKLRGTYMDMMDLVRHNIMGHNPTDTSIVHNLVKNLFAAEGQKPPSAEFMRKFMEKRAIFFSGAAMSARPALAIRNMFQSFLPGLKTGFAENFRAHGEAMSNWREVQKEAIEVGAVDDLQGMFLMHELDHLDEGLIRKLHNIGLIPYRKADTYNRIVSYLTGRNTVRKWGKKLAEGKTSIDNFLFRTGLAGDAVSVQREVLKSISSGDLDGASKYYGRKMADSTQFLYSRSAAPMAFQGNVGRLVGQFGIWPMAYTEYIAKNMGTSGWGFTSKSMRAKYSAAFAARWLSMAMPLIAAGAALGIDTSSYNFANPFDFEGGPAIQATRDMVNLVAARNPYEQKVAQANIGRNLGAFVLPFMAAGADWSDAVESDRLSDKILLGMGFNPIGDRRKRMEKRRGGQF
jgi:hypothetical protein